MTKRSPAVSRKGRPYAGVGRPANDFHHFHVMWKGLCDFL